MNKLQQFVFDLLTSKEISVLIGYESGSANKPRPAFFIDPAEIEHLIFNDQCKQNLTVYLGKRKIIEPGKIAIIATLPALRSILQLASENQIKESDLFVIYCKNNSEFEVYKDFIQIEEFVKKEEFTIDPKNSELIEYISKLTVEQRFEYWTEQFSKCIKCYACRAACPLCYCTRCTVEINQPQWVHGPSHALGNFEWHIMRAMHMAGRCLNCDACRDACPVDIPLNLLTKFMIRDVKEKFGEYTFSSNKANLLSTFKPDDKETLIG
jgi:ferredoxin